MLGLFLLAVSSICCITTAKLIRNHKEKVVDIIHSNFPKIHAPYLSDSLVAFQLVKTVNNITVDNLNEILVIISIVQFLRSICSISTVLPPLKHYSDKYRLGGINGSGTEYIFSGHASYSALTSIYLYKNGITSFFSIFVYNILSQFLIIATHNHYTVDIILAWIITPLIYGNIRFCRQLEWCESKISYLF